VENTIGIPTAANA
jgi:hypothetical protein